MIVNVPLFSFHQLLFLCMILYGMEYFFGLLGSAVSPPNFLCTPSLFAVRAVRGADEALVLC